MKVTFLDMERVRQDMRIFIIVEEKIINVVSVIKEREILKIELNYRGSMV